MRFIVIALLSAALAFGAAAADFQNLDFESVNRAAISSSSQHFFGPASELVPGWRIFQGSRELDRVFVNDLLFEGGGAFLSTSLPAFGGLPSFAIEGDFTMLLYVGPTSEALTISQRAVIPPNFGVLSYSYRGDPFDVSVNGVTPKPIAQNASVLTPIRVALDVRQFAGQEVDLTFRIAGVNAFPAGPGGHLLDAIQFTIPEPSTCVVFCLGIALCAFFRFRSRTSR